MAEPPVELRIWYQSFGAWRADHPYAKTLQEMIRQVVAPTTVVGFGGLEGALTAGKQYRALHAFDVPALLRRLGRAESEGYDALVIGNALDPGLYEARQLFSRPVLGLGQATLLYAHLLATRVLVVASGPAALPVLRDNAARYGLERIVVGFAHAGVGVDEVGEAFAHRDLARRLCRRFRERVRVALVDEAEAVIPASGVLQALLYREGVREVEGRPVLPGILVTAKMAEAAACLARHGVVTSPIGAFAKLPQHLERIARAVLGASADADRPSAGADSSRARPSPGPG